MAYSRRYLTHVVGLYCLYARLADQQILPEFGEIVSVGRRQPDPRYYDSFVSRHSLIPNVGLRWSNKGRLSFAYTPLDDY